MELNQIASFVVRFQLAAFEKETGEKQWRIKVTHVQEDKETLFESIEEALIFMKAMAEKA
ncbi:hypothetical protein QF028_000501 [Neobacillus sp. B4I6]|jgi:hypothetical protein|uniref:hypothetical protein n=1 Tax=Bacillaceae TaxID=186817 RepID=UPI001BE5C0F0|nr:hypothetical protein [Bacillus sp. ISL-7]MBT2736639.1 hypothetical protein [Bacillus sp. ISL-7]